MAHDHFENVRQSITLNEAILTFARFGIEVLEMPSCNDCGKIRDCKYAPDWGDDVRINCPLWASGKVES